jgi:hypothetical protein
MSRGDFQLLKDTPIVDLFLDEGNARIRDGRDQADCISKILRKEDQLMALMADIAENGLTTMPILVKPVGGKLVVMDGNRRLTALKLLNDVHLCPVERLKSDIKQLQKRFAANIVSAVDVLSASDDQAIAREVLARHSGAQGGVGQLDWSAYLRTVYLLNHGHPADYKRAGQYALWAEKQGIWVDDEFPVTSLQRFFSIENLKSLGFKVEEDELVPIIALDEAKRMGQTLMSDFQLKVVKVDDVKTPTLASTYIAGLRQRCGLAPSPAPAAAPVPAAATGSQSTSSPVSGSGPSAGPGAAYGTGATGPLGGTSAVGAATTPPTAPAPTPTPKTSPSERPKVFGQRSPGIGIPSTETKAATIVAEIRALNVKSNPMACAMLLRGLIELSSNYYHARNLPPLPPGSKSIPLGKSVLQAATHMESLGVLSTSEFDIVRRLSDPSVAASELLHIETLQKVMHRDTHHTTYQFVNTLWDNVAPFVRACWR